MRNLLFYARKATITSLIALSIACIGACSGTSSSGTNAASGGGSGTVSSSGGTSASGGVGETGGASSATGGTSKAGSSTPKATGGASTDGSSTPKASGGVTTASGGTFASGGSKTAVGGTTTGSEGGTSERGGTSSGVGGGASGGKSSALGGASAAGGSAATGGSGTQTGGAATGGTSGGGAATGGTAAGGAATGGASPGNNRSPGCGKAISRPNPRTQQTIDIGGTTRYYLLDVPANADNQTPLMLIFGLHGYDMNNVAVIDRYTFTSRSSGKAITVMPQGEGPPPGDVSHWGDQVLKSTWTANDANYNFIRTLMTDLESRYCIDKNRVFLAGFSMGGFFTNSLACAHSDWFRAFAPISGGVAGASCGNASVKPPIMIHHGTADDVVAFSNGEATRDYWTKQNACSQTNKSSYTGCQSFDGCAGPVVFCVGSWKHDITATVTANVWSFFSSFN